MRTKRRRQQRFAATVLCSVAFVALSMGTAYAAPGDPAPAPTATEAADPVLGPVAPAADPSAPIEQPPSPILGPPSPIEQPPSPILGPPSPIEQPPSPILGPPSPIIQPTTTPKPKPKPKPRPKLKPHHQAISTWAPGQEAWLDVPAVGLHRRIFVGGQSVIDEGVVTHYTAPGAPALVAAGSRGVYWLAGHHSTHGAPLARATSIAVGDLVIITLRDRVVRYRIVEELRTPTEISAATFYGPDPSASRLLLQTCLSESRRLLLIGILRAG